MQQRGRKSAASHLLPVGVGGEPARLVPPAFLSAEEAALFAEVVAACDACHFRKSDESLLVAFVQATLMSREAAHDPSNIMVWEKATRMQATLATRLRLAPQSRIDPKTLGRRSEPPRGPMPWEYESGQDC
jgi:hypothetical protein